MVEPTESSGPPETTDADGPPSPTGVGTPFGQIVDQVVTLVIAITIALAIRQFVIEPFRIPSGSMFPTLLIGDHLFVNKLAYGPNVPLSELRLPGFSEPKRGDVVVFEVARSEIAAATAAAAADDES